MATKQIANRVKEVREVKVKDLVENPLNFREHPPEQRGVIRAAFKDHGIVDVVSVYEKDGQLILIDGHLRREELDDEQLISVAILDVTEDEANRVLMTKDAIGSMATLNRDKTKALTSITATQFKSGELRDITVALEAGNLRPLTFVPDGAHNTGGDPETITRDRCPACKQIIRRTVKAVKS